MDTYGNLNNNFVYSTKQNRIILFEGRSYLLNIEDYKELMDMLDKKEYEMAKCFLLISNDVVDVTDKICYDLPSFGYSVQNNKVILFKGINDNDD